MPAALSLPAGRETAMTKQEFEGWIEQHYGELVDVAYQRTRRDGTRRQRRDTGQADARDAVQSAVARALGSATFADLDATKAWPWMVDAVRGVVFNARRDGKRASKTHREWAGAFLDEQGRHGKHTPVPIHESDQIAQKRPELIGKRGSGRIAAVDPYQNDDENGHDFVGPRGAWKGEYTVAHLGKCPCGSESFSRIEIGRDVERQGYSKRWTVEALMAIEHAVKQAALGSVERLAGYALGSVAAMSAIRTIRRQAQVLGCLNGHRTHTGEIA